MVHSCVVRGCGSSWYPGCDLTFHLFPKDVDRRKLWLSIVPLKRKFYENAKICSLHFREPDYDFSSKRLKPTASPSFCEEIPDKIGQLETINAPPVIVPIVPCTDVRHVLSVIPLSPSVSCSRKRKTSEEPVNKLALSTSTDPVKIIHSAKKRRITRSRRKKGRRRKV